LSPPAIPVPPEQVKEAGRQIRGDEEEKRLHTYMKRDKHIQDSETQDSF